MDFHDRNFKPLVYLWKPLHNCFVRLRSVWVTRNDIINVFCSFIALSYGKVMYQTLRIASCSCLSNVSEFGTEKRVCPSLLDPNIECWSNKHLSYVIPVFFVSFIFNVLPAFLLVLYPIKQCRKLLYNCKLESVRLNTFIEKFHSCYKNGLDGGQDMRSFSGFYFFVILLTSVCHGIALKMHLVEPTSFFTKGILFWTVALIIALTKPYKNTHMNVLECLLLANIGLMCSILPSSSGMLNSKQYPPNSFRVLYPQLLVLLPFAIHLFYIGVRIALMMYNLTKISCKRLKTRTTSTTVYSGEGQPILGFRQNVYGTTAAPIACGP